MNAAAATMIRVSRQFCAACLAALVLLSAGPAHATGPTDTLRDFFARVNGLIQAPEDQMTLAARLALIHRMTHQVFDVRRAAANVFGKEWTARTPSEQEEFVDLFGDVLQRGYLALIGSKVRITGGVDVTFIDEAVAGDVAVVRTALTARSNGELSIDYRMSRADGTWWVVDTIIGGVSLVANYRAQIVRIRQRSTHRELIALMRSVAGTSTNPETAVAETMTPTDTMTSAGADAPVTAAVRTLPVEMTTVSVTAPSAPPPTRAASLPANTSPIAAPSAATNTLCGEPVPNTTAPSLTLRPAQRDPKRFWVQIGAFRDSESAAQLVERLADPGVMIVTLPSPGRPPVPLMWVCVGPFTTQSAVDAKARELTAAGYHALIATQLP
jgi:ABC-type transporter MlaC component